MSNLTVLALKRGRSTDPVDIGNRVLLHPGRKTTLLEARVESSLERLITAVESNRLVVVVDGSPLTKAESLAVLTPTARTPEEQVPVDHTPETPGEEQAEDPPEAPAGDQSEAPAEDDQPDSEPTQSRKKKRKG